MTGRTASGKVKASATRPEVTLELPSVFVVYAAVRSPDEAGSEDLRHRCRSMGSASEAIKFFPHHQFLRPADVRGGQDLLVPASSSTKLMWQKRVPAAEVASGDVIWKARSDKVTARR